MRNVDVPAPSFEWMSRTLEWGTRVRPTNSGLRVGDLNVGIYGEIPDHWEEQTRNAQGRFSDAWHSTDRDCAAR